METITINGVERTLEFSFESMKYIEDLDFSVMQHFDKKPLKLLGVTEMLIFGALNHDDRVFIQRKEAKEAVKQAVKDNNLMPLFEKLIGLLEESDFFKSLQGK